MSDVAWTTAHSVDSHASLPFAWAYMTNVANWDDPPATFELEGPFTAGTRGTTRIPGQEPRHWQVEEVNPHVCSGILALEHDVLREPCSVWQPVESPLERDGCPVQFRFEYVRVKQVQEAFASSLAAGMSKIVGAIERAEAFATSATSRPQTEPG